MHCEGALHQSLLNLIDPRQDISSCIKNPFALTAFECQMRSPAFSHFVTTSKDILNGLRKGETLQLRQLQSMLSSRHPLMKLAKELEFFLGHPLDSISLFVSPSFARALPKHFDNTEIFTFQISGTKKWLLYKDADVVEINISAGDLLYVPAKCWHEVKSESEPSISIAIVFRPVLLEALILELVRDILHKSGNAQETLPIMDNDFDKNFDNTKLKNCLSRVTGELRGINSDTVLKLAQQLSLIYSKEAPLDLTGTWWTDNSSLKLERNPYTQYRMEVSGEFVHIYLATGAIMILPAFAEFEITCILNNEKVNCENTSGKYLEDEELALIQQAMCRVGLLRVRGENKKKSQGSENCIAKKAITKVIARCSCDAEFRELVLINSAEAFRLIHLSEDEISLLGKITFLDCESSNADSDTVQLPKTYRCRLQPTDIKYLEPEGYER